MIQGKIVHNGNEITKAVFIFKGTVLTIRTMHKLYKAEEIKRQTKSTMPSFIN